VDGRNLGEVPEGPLAVRPGAHDVRLVGRDRKEQRQRVDVASGRTVTARFQ